MYFTDDENCQWISQFMIGKNQHSNLTQIYHIFWHSNLRNFQQINGIYWNTSMFENFKSGTRVSHGMLVWHNVVLPTKITYWWILWFTCYNVWWLRSSLELSCQQFHLCLRCTLKLTGHIYLPDYHWCNAHMHNLGGGEQVVVPKYNKFWVS